MLRSQVSTKPGYAQCPAEQLGYDAEKTKTYEDFFSMSAVTLAGHVMKVGGANPLSQFNGAIIREVIEPMDTQAAIALESNFNGDNRAIVPCPFMNADLIRRVCADGTNDGDFVVGNHGFVRLRDPDTNALFRRGIDGGEARFIDQIAFWADRDSTLMAMGAADRCRFGCEQDYQCGAAVIGAWRRIAEVAVVDGDIEVRMISSDVNSNATFRQSGD